MVVECTPPSADKADHRRVANVCRLVVHSALQSSRAITIRIGDYVLALGVQDMAFVGCECKCYRVFFLLMRPWDYVIASPVRTFLVWEYWMEYAGELSPSEKTRGFSASTFSRHVATCRSPKLNAVFVLYLGAKQFISQMIRLLESNSLDNKTRY